MKDWPDQVELGVNNFLADPQDWGEEELFDVHNRPKNVLLLLKNLSEVWKSNIWELDCDGFGRLCPSLCSVAWLLAWSGGGAIALPCTCSTYGLDVKFNLIKYQLGI